MDIEFYRADAGRSAKVLAGYIQYISDIVVKETLENIRNQLEIKTRYEQEKLAMDRVRLKTSLMPIFNVSIIRWKSPTPLALRDRFTAMVRR